jgi:hypothetical protein
LRIRVESFRITRVYGYRFKVKGLRVKGSGLQGSRVARVQGL